MAEISIPPRAAVPITGWSQPGFIPMSPEQQFMQQQRLGPYAPRPVVPTGLSAPTSIPEPGPSPSQALSPGQQKAMKMLEKENARAAKASAERVAQSHREAVAARQAGLKATGAGRLTRALPGGSMLRSSVYAAAPSLVPMAVAEGAEQLGMISPDVAADVQFSPFEFTGRSVAQTLAHLTEIAPEWMGGWSEEEMQRLRQDPSRFDPIWEGFPRAPQNAAPQIPSPAVSPMQGAPEAQVPMPIITGQEISLGAAPQLSPVDYMQLAALMPQTSAQAVAEAPSQMDFLLSALSRVGFNPNMAMGENLLNIGLAGLTAGPQAREAQRTAGVQTRQADAQAQQARQKMLMDLALKQITGQAETQQQNAELGMQHQKNQLAALQQATNASRPIPLGDGVAAFPQPVAPGVTAWQTQQVGQGNKASMSQAYESAIQAFLANPQTAGAVMQLMQDPTLTMADKDARAQIIYAKLFAQFPRAAQAELAKAIGGQ